MDASTLSSMLANPLSHSFLDTYILSTSSLGCSVLCMVYHYYYYYYYYYYYNQVHDIRRTGFIGFTDLVFKV